MKVESITPSEPNPTSANVDNEVTGTLPYHSPTLRTYGGLAELVQFNPGTGTDGGLADCSHS